MAFELAWSRSFLLFMRKLAAQGRQRQVDESSRFGKLEGCWFGLK